MIDALADAPIEVIVLAMVLLIALGFFGWSMYRMLHGPQAKIRRRLAIIAGTQSNSAPDRQRRAGQQERRRSVQARLKEIETARERARGYRLREQLRLAGLDIEIWHYLAASGVLCVVVLFAARLASLGWLGSLLTGLIIGFGLPKLVVGFMAKRRVGKFTGLFSDAIDIVVRGIRSGLPLGECLNIIGREMPDPVGLEFRSIIEAQKLGITLQDALNRSVARMPIPELRYFSIVIAIQQQTGGNLAETLAKLSDVLRARKRMRDKVQAYASEAKTSAYIIGSLPFIVILALAGLAPHYIGILFTTDTGNMLLFIGGMTEITGLLVMRKMINFDM